MCLLGQRSCWACSRTLVGQGAPYHPPEVYRVVREMLPRDGSGPVELLLWLEDAAATSGRAAPTRVPLRPPYNEPSTIANKYSICTPLNRPARHSHTSETCQPLRNCNPISPIKPLPNPILLSKYQTMSHNVMPEEKSPHNLIAQPQHPLPHRPPPATANVRKRPGKQKLPTTAPRPTPHSRPNAPTPFLDALSAHPLD